MAFKAKRLNETAKGVDGKKLLGEREATKNDIEEMVAKERPQARCGETGTLVSCCWGCKMLQSFYSLAIPQVVQHGVIIWPSNSTCTCALAGMLSD